MPSETAGLALYSMISNMSLPFLVALGLLCAAVVWKASIVLEDSTDQLCQSYNIPPIVQGSLIAAVASSLPELSSSVFSILLHGEFELGVSIVVGSAIFNILVIPGLSGFNRPLKVDLKLVYRDAQFYIIAIAVLLLSFSLAVIYRPLPGVGLRGELGWGIALLPLSLYGLYLFLQFQDTTDSGSPDTNEETPRIKVGREWFRVVVSVLLVLVSTEGLVRTAIGLGDHFGTPSFFWGVTVVAAATSAPDAVISFQAARAGRGIVSLGNVIGSNVFDLLVAIPAGVLLAGSVVIDYAIAAPLMGALTVVTIVLFAALRLGTVLTPFESRLLLVLYAAFVVWMVLETAGVTTALSHSGNEE